MRRDSRFWMRLSRGWAACLIAATAFVAGPSWNGMAYAQEVCEACEEEAAAPEAEAPDYPTIMGLLGDRGEALAERNISLRGNIVQSVTFNPEGPTDRFNGPVTWTDRSNDYQLNQLWFTAERTTNGEDGLDLGFRSDTFWGTNARFCTAQGFENQIDNGHAFYGLAFPNLYAEAAYGDWKVKGGRFISPVGYFTIDMTQNFFNTLPYTYQYGEPFTHTGVLATKTVSENLEIGSGVTRGWDNWSGTGFGAPHLGWIGLVTLKGDDFGNLTWFGHWSQEPTEDNDGFNNAFSGRYIQSLVYQKTLKNINENLSMVIQSDFGTQERAKSVNNTTPGFAGRSAQWYGLNSYLFWKQSDAVTWGLNGEWFRDEDGFRVGTLLPPLVGSEFRGLPAGRNGYIGNFYQITFGPRWQPFNNLYIRPNLRWDWFDGTLDTFKNTAGRPYDDGTKNFQFIIGTDVYMLF